MLHELTKLWFTWVEQWGYWGVFILMAMESSIIPVPSEVVMPPAAYFAAQGKMNFWGVVFAGTAGSYVGSIMSYLAAQWLGLPFIRRYGKYFLLSPDKVRMAEAWVKQYGVIGIFVARLLPVVRHLISMPAGVFRMRVVPFSLATTIGAFIWCTILAWFGKDVLGKHPELLDSPEQMVGALKSELRWFVLGVVALGALYAIVVRFKKSTQAGGDTGAGPGPTA